MKSIQEEIWDEINRWHRQVWRTARAAGTDKADSLYWRLERQERTRWTLGAALQNALEELE